MRLPCRIVLPRVGYAVATVAWVSVAACTPDSGGGAGLATSGSWVYVQTTVATPDGRTSTLQLTDDPAFGTLRRELAVELPGNTRVFSDGRRLFTGSAEEPVLQRWHPTTDGGLVPGERLSLAAEGFTSVPYGNTFARADKAYLFDGATARALIWDPATLTVTGEVDLSAIEKPGLTPALDPGVVVGKYLFGLVQQYDFATNALFRGLQVVVIDVDTDTVVAVLEDERCVGGVGSLAVTDDEDLLVLGDNYLVMNWFDETLPPTCLLSIDTTALRFDDAAPVDLEQLTGGPSVGLVHDGARTFVQALDESASETDPRIEPLAFLNAPVARWWTIDRVDPRASRPLAGIGLVSPRSGPGFVIEGRTYLQGASAGFTGQTSLLEVVDDRSVEVRGTVTGLITGLGPLDLQAAP
ncbi:MAG: hypothetical protein AAF602_08860 [Myxococcota bacterium]